MILKKCQNALKMCVTLLTSLFECLSKDMSNIKAFVFKYFFLSGPGTPEKKEIENVSTYFQLADI